MKSSAYGQQQQPQPPDQVQSAGERPQSPQPVFEPEQAQPEAGSEEIAQRAYAIYEQRGRQSGYDVQDWLQAEQELRNRVPTDEAA